MRYGAACGAAGILGLLLTLLTGSAAAGPSEARDQAGTIVSQAEAGVSEVARRAKGASVRRIQPAERIAGGEILLRNKDWERAIQTLSQVLELADQHKADENSRGDAEFLVAEAYFGSGQLLSARRHFLAVLGRAPTPPYDSYAGRAASRLVDIALRTGSDVGLDEVEAKLRVLPATDSSGSMQYARAKLGYSRNDYARAREAVAQVPVGSTYLHQAMYLQGVVLTKDALTTASVAPVAPVAPGAAPPVGSGQPAPKAPPPVATIDAAKVAVAIEQFRAVTRLPPDTVEHRHVIDLAWLGIARLQYETDALLDAADAYNHVGRTSPEFSTALYEVAWVYARLGDYQRSQRALEVLAITDPQSLSLADGPLLRADLMLRSGQFDKALSLYQSVKGRFEPIRAQLDAFLTSTNDPAVFYDRLVADSLEQQGHELSPVVLEWAREEAESDHAFSVIDDVTRSRDLVRRSRRLASQLSSLLSSSTRVRAFPELKAALEQTLGAVNRVTQARLILARALDSLARDEVSGELQPLRQERRALMAKLDQLPITAGDFARREASGESQWNAVSQQLQRLTLEVDKLQAIINALSRVVHDADQHGIKADPATRERFTAEIAANERDLSVYRERIHGYRDAVDNGRVQIGFGDARFQDDSAARLRFRQVFAQEVRLVASGQDSEDASAYAKTILSMLDRAELAETQLEKIMQQLEAEAAEKARSLQDEVAREAEAVEQQSLHLDELDQQARLLVGEVAMKNFAMVRDRLKSIVLRADVGVVQQAWEVREEQRTRVLNLQRERAREEQNLNDELREVLDDAEGSP